MVEITIKNLVFGYNSHKILDGVNIIVKNSEVLSLVGPNGSGKTTLLKCMDRILKPQGSILMDGQEIERMSRLEVARQIGYVPQSSSTPLATTVFDTVLMGRRPHIAWGCRTPTWTRWLGVERGWHLEELPCGTFPSSPAAETKLLSPGPGTGAASFCIG